MEIKEDGRGRLIAGSLCSRWSPTKMPNIEMDIPNKPSMHKARWRWWAYLVLINQDVVWSGIVGSLASKTAHHHTSASPAMELLFNLSIELLIFGVIFGLAFFLTRVSIEDLLLQWRGVIRPVWQGIFYAVALLLAIPVLIMLMLFVLRILGVLAPGQMMDIFAAGRRGTDRLLDSSALRHDRIFFWLALTLVSFVFAGFREELWRSAFFVGARALWPQTFKSRLGQVAVVALAAAMFGFGHALQGSVAVLNAGLIGFVLGLIILSHRSIWPAVIAHGLCDAVAIAMNAYSHGS